MLHKYKVGDKVRIKRRADRPNEYPFCFGDYMASLEGKIFTIKSITTCDKSDSIFNCKHNNGDYNYYGLKEDKVKWAWHSSMFEPVLEDSEQKIQTPVSLHEGDLIEICGMIGSIYNDGDNSEYYLDFDNIRDEQEHFTCCKKLRELVPNFDKIADEFDPIRHESEFFPEFSTINDLGKFVQAINNAYNSKKSITPKTLNENEIKFQKPKASYVRGSIPKGNPICGRKHKTAIVVGCLSNQEISC